MEWISVEDSLPEEYVYVLVFAKSPGTNEPCPIGIARHNGQQWESLMENWIGAWSDICWDYRPEHITHWIPLPSPPKVI